MDDRRIRDRGYAGDGPARYCLRGFVSGETCSGRLVFGIAPAKKTRIPLFAGEAVRFV
jgi:hypothetical protein